MEKRPQVAVGVFCIDSRRRICLVRTKKVPAWLTIPGGHLDFGETLEDCARREFLEETGTSLVQVSFDSWIELPEQKRHLILFNFKGFAADPKQLPTDKEEVIETIWLPLETAKTDVRVLPRLRDELSRIFPT